MCVVRIECQGSAVQQLQLTKPDEQPVTNDEFHNFVCDIREVFKGQLAKFTASRHDPDQTIVIKLSTEDQAGLVAALVQNIWDMRQNRDRLPFAERQVPFLVQ